MFHRLLDAIDNTDVGDVKGNLNSDCRAMDEPGLVMAIRLNVIENGSFSQKTVFSRVLFVILHGGTMFRG